MTTDGHDHVDPAPDPEPTTSLYEGLTPPGQVGHDPSRGFVAADLPPDEHVAEEVRACTALRDATEAEVQAAAAAAIQASNDDTCRQLGQPTDAELLARLPRQSARQYGKTRALDEAEAAERAAGRTVHRVGADAARLEAMSAEDIDRASEMYRDPQAHAISIDRALIPPGIATNGDRVTEPYTTAEMLEAVAPTDKDYLIQWDGSGWVATDVDREVRARGGTTRTWVNVRDVADQIQVYPRCADPDTPIGTPLSLRPGEWIAYTDGTWGIGATDAAATHTAGWHDRALDAEEAKSLRAVAAEASGLVDEVHHLAVEASRMHTPPPRDTTAARRAARARTREVCETLQAITITATLPVVCVLAVLILLRVFLWMG